MREHEYTVVIPALSAADGGGGYLATVRELPGCSSDGATGEDGVRNVRSAIEAWIGEAEELGRPIPEPRPSAAVA
jgi:antitoxin HicB